MEGLNYEKEGTVTSELFVKNRKSPGLGRPEMIGLLHTIQD